MSVEGIDKLEKSLGSLRRRVDELELGQVDAEARLRFGVLASALSGALVALSATTWRTIEGFDGEVRDSATLWGLAGDSGPAAWTLIGVLVVAVGTVATALTDNAGRAAHAVFVVFCVLTAVGIFVVGGSEGFYEPERVQAGPGRWLTLLAVLVTGVAHAHRFTVKGSR